MKNKYESVIILKGILTEEEYKQSLNIIIEKIKQLVNIEKIEEKGLKKLAYEIKDIKTGYYVIIYLKADSQSILEMERIYRITDDVLRFLTIKNVI